MRKLTLCALLALLTLPALADVEFIGSVVRYYNSVAGTNDNAELFTTGDMSQYDACTIMSTDGAVDVFISLDGTNYSTAALSLQDLGATTSDPVVVTAADRVYGFVIKARRIKILQNGATAASASMLCWKM